jgi:flagellar hook-basal body complex protein FliE
MKLLVEQNLLKINEFNIVKQNDSMLKTVNDEGTTFEKVYSAALNMIEETNTYIKQEDQLKLDFATGKNDDMLGLMMAQMKADASLNFTIQMTNRVVESYKEIMRMQL